ncbi:MAG TPA: TetR/AcrR family transcriptional regulator [Spirochaetota bacterium]|nr:TetR/AcrR family transcriptional regulator [Spirochaetota bacterium]
METKEKILNSAAKIFAEKSYDGSRVDQIAEHAGIPKSLIYYHFKSKESILNTLIEAFISDLVRIQNNIKEIYEHEKTIAPNEQIIEKVVPFFQEKSDIMRIIMAESLKVCPSPPIFRVLKTVIDSKRSAACRFNNIDYDNPKTVLREFINYIIPVFTFSCLYNSFSDIYGFDRNLIIKHFIDIMDQNSCENISIFENK